MPVAFLIVGKNGKLVEVTPEGQLVVGPITDDETEFRELAEPDTAVSFYDAKVGQKFVITGIVARADQQVSNTVDADVVIYEADSDSTTTVDKVLFQQAMVRNAEATLIGLNIKVNEGKWVNAKTTDDDIHMTIMGHFVEV